MTAKTNEPDSPIGRSVIIESPEAKRIEGLQKLRATFPKESYGKLPKAGVPGGLDYVGHAAVTDRLLSVDPFWNWEPLAYDQNGMPFFVRDQNGKPIGLWIKLTVLGVTRLGFGNVLPNAFDAEKQLIGDALRIAAARFGVALDLWSKAELESVVDAGQGHSAPPATIKQAAQAAKPQAAPKPAPQAQSAPPPAQEQHVDFVPEYEIVRGEEPPMIMRADERGNITIFGVPMAETVFTGFKSWGKYAIESKQAAIKGKLWSTMPDGEAGGGRESWLRFVVGTAQNILSGKEEGKILQVHQRAAVCLWLMLDKAYREALDKQNGADFHQAIGQGPNDVVEDDSAPF